MAEKSRTLTFKGFDNISRNATTQALIAAQIVSININEDAGSHIPIGGGFSEHYYLEIRQPLGAMEPGRFYFRLKKHWMAQLLK